MSRRRAAGLLLLVAVALAAPAAAQPEVDALISLGIQRYLARDLPGALAAFEQAYARAPRNPRAVYMRAQVYRDLKKLPEAEAGFRAALVLDPTLTDVRGELGALLSDTGRYREAAVELARVVAEKPDHFEAHFNLGVAYEALGEKDAAVDAYRSATRVKPGDADAFLNLAVALLRAGRTDEALVAAREAARLAPDDPMARRNLGLILSEARRFDEAVAELTASTRLAPDDYRGYWRLGIVELRRNQPERAVAALERARTLDGNADVRLDLGLALAAAGRCPQALTEIAAVPATPQHAEAIGRVRARCPARQ